MFVGKRMKKFLSLFNIGTCYNTPLYAQVFFTAAGSPAVTPLSYHYHISSSSLSRAHFCRVQNKKICVMPSDTEFFGANSLQEAGRTKSAHTSRPVGYTRPNGSQRRVYTYNLRSPITFVYQEPKLRRHLRGR